MLSVENFMCRYKKDVPSFENFLVRDSNSEAFESVKALSKYPIDKSPVPLFVEGKTGCGKTHLLKSLYIELNDDENCRVLYIFCEAIVAHLLTFIRKSETDILRRRFSGVDVLLIDNCEYAERSEQLQLELSALIKTMTENNKQVVLAVSSEEEKLSVLKEKLGSGCYKEVKISEPDYDFSRAYLEDLLKRNNMELTRGIKKYILKQSKNHLSMIKCAVNKIRLVEPLIKKPVTLKMVKKWI